MGDHYFSQHPSSEIKERTFSEEIKGTALTFKSVSGVFSFGEKIDRASHLLIENFKPCNPDNAETILDLGCGYGAIGLFLKALHGACAITLCDINTRAVQYTLQNSIINSLKVEVQTSDLYSSLSGRLFDHIVSNPPLAAGKSIIFKLIEEASVHLNNNGCLWLVAYHNKGGSTLKQKMKDCFGNVEDVEKSGGIRVYRSVRKIS